MQVQLLSLWKGMATETIFFFFMNYNFNSIISLKLFFMICSSYLPPLKEETISSQGASFLPREARKSLFHGKTFIFISKKQVSS